MEPQTLQQMDVARQGKSQKIEHITNTMYNLVCGLTAVAAALSDENNKTHGKSVSPLIW